MDSDNIKKNKTVEKVASLFRYIYELNKLRKKTILNVKDYEWSLFVNNLPDDSENVKLYYRDRVEDDTIDIEHDIILSVHKPEFQSCPNPPDTLSKWLRYGWDDFHKVAECFPSLSYKKYNPVTAADELVSINFADDSIRVSDFENWLKFRDIWAANQKRIEAVRNLFITLYSEYYALKRDAETKEIIVANGIFCDAENRSVCHPLLTHRVKLDYDPDKNIMYIRDTDAESELYTDVLQNLSEINLSDINELRESLLENDYHPLDRNDTPDFLKILIRQLSSDSIFSAEGVPDKWQQHNRFLMYLNPCFIIRKRPDGTLKAIEKINEAITDGCDIPSTLVDLVDGGKIEVSQEFHEYSIEEQLAEVGGESIDVLLSKAANREQLEIAKRIEKYNAVLVQGPPGTGKTHTIANLAGYFIAQGKSVLITSHTSKALSVLKEKLVAGLQNLCVSLIDDNNKDMERAIDGITDYMSRTTSFELKRDMDSLAEERRFIIKRLGEVRRNIYRILHQESESIVYRGEGITPSAAARFVNENKEKLNYIPGRVHKEAEMPLSFDELIELYRSNGDISEYVQMELACELPAPDELLSPNEFTELCKNLSCLEEKLALTNKQADVRVSNLPEQQGVMISLTSGDCLVKYPDNNLLKDLLEYCNNYSDIEEWKRAVAADGKAGGGYRERWLTLIEQINTVNKLGAEFANRGLGKDIEIAEGTDLHSVLPLLHKVKGFFDKDGKLPFGFKLFYSDCNKALQSVLINGVKPASSSDCAVIINYIELELARNICGKYWENLLVPYGIAEFSHLGVEPERKAGKYVEPIKYFLDWHKNECQVFLDKVKAVGFPEKEICGISDLDSEQDIINKQLNAIHNVIPAYCKILLDINTIEEYKSNFEKLSEKISCGSRINSTILQKLNTAVINRDSESYRESYSALSEVYEKYNLQIKRNEYIKRMEPYAPDWAEAIRNRIEIHGESAVPHDVEDAWKWKQLSLIVEEITSVSLEQYQEESRQLSKQYRNATAKYAEKSGWYHLLKRTEENLDLKQALQGWKQIVKKIGKGTGKNAPMYKAEARRKMVHCQKAVPAWIMPINKAMETLNPSENKFDIVIVDEASQSDISSLAILYMGKKLIIVGDDKQVSPMAIGLENEQIKNLRDMYLHEEIPNRINYDAKTSIYDIAMTTYQPLMLREHFRCVPDIIGYCNNLSYDGKILPLRSASSSTLLPAIINYRVDGTRDGKNKINEKEAEVIVELIKKCIAKPEYDGKTFGVISLLGDEQAKRIQALIERNLPPKEIEERRILCGNSANFQGDERDVIFLSMVDSADGDGPLSLMGYGTDDAYRKRYNVAVSRAKDQLWVVNSLDPSIDLKAGDLRKGLLEYAKDPHAATVRKAEIERKADSPFEIAVVTELTNRGYHIIQQKEVGAYRIDMVAVCGEKEVAVECDGERWHSSSEQIRRDMERQAILERLGWYFIRIRGSEFYRDKEKVIQRVVDELEKQGIMPEAMLMKTNRL